MAKFKFSVTVVSEEYKQIQFLSRFSELNFNDQFYIALIIGSERHTITDNVWYKGNVVMRSCIVKNGIAEDVIKILNNYK